jgi:hypothetical protein
MLLLLKADLLLLRRKLQRAFLKNPLQPPIKGSSFTVTSRPFILKSRTFTLKKKAAKGFFKKPLATPL